MPRQADILLLNIWQESGGIDAAVILRNPLSAVDLMAVQVS